MLYIPAYPAHLNNPYYEYVSSIFATALKYDAVTNPNGLQWLQAIYPHGEQHGNTLRGYDKFREYTPIQPDDSFMSLCYFLPQEPLTRVGGDSWQFFFDVVFFVNLDAILLPDNNPRGRYHAVLMEEAISAINKLVWGFSKDLIEARVIATDEIFAEIEIDSRYLTAPFAAFRLRYDIHISAFCVEPTIPTIFQQLPQPTPDPQPDPEP